MNDDELLRYSRHIMMPDFDYERQEKLKLSTVLIVGAGGLGCPAAMYLAAAGVGRLMIIDDDHVDLSNLQRQIAFQESAIQSPKAEALKNTILQLNSSIECEVLLDRLDRVLAEKLIAEVDLVLDCTDNFKTRFMLNRCCVAQKTPLVSAAAIRSEGQISVFDSRQENSPCYACLYSDDVESETLNCSEAGVLSPLVGVMGAMQAAEAIKVLSEFGKPIVGRLTLYDAKQGEWRSLKISKDMACEVCGI